MLEEVGWPFVDGGGPGLGGLGFSDPVYMEGREREYLYTTTQELFKLTPHIVLASANEVWLLAHLYGIIVNHR